jgi:UDP-N-acetylglucosamine 4,6-dehydratase
LSIFDNSSVLITGGTGSLGKSLIRFLLDNTSVRRIAIFSRDELKQHSLRNELGENKRLRWFLGDIRDLERLKMAMHDVDFVVHTAALKQVDTGEYNPSEFIKTNVLGSQNVIEASIYSGVKRVVALSTDKASSPINLYGATKLTADKLFVSANNYSQSYGTSFSVVRYGNVMGSRGSVIPFWKAIVEKGNPIPITDPRMTRFWISIDEAVNFVLNSLETMQGGELFVPIIPSFRLIDLAKAISTNSKFNYIGIRPGEKLHEEMISAEDSRRTLKISDKKLIVIPTIAEWSEQNWQGEKWEEGKAYSSINNEHFLSVEELKGLIR